jgi:predicted cupin superfamily sugar epimerase
MLLLDDQGQALSVLLGNDLFKGQVPQFIVPRGTWQGSRLAAGGRFALLGTTMAPAFDLEDFETPTDWEGFIRRYSKEWHGMIRALG